MLRPWIGIPAVRQCVRWSSSMAKHSSTHKSPANRWFMLGGVTATGVFGFTVLRKPEPAHAAAEDPQSGGLSGWFVKPWTSYQAVAAQPDRVPGYERVHVLRKTLFSMSLFTKIRDKETPRGVFAQSARKLADLLLADALCLLPCRPRTVTTPVDGATYVGIEIPDPEKELCVVSILRAADCMADEFMRQLPGVPAGKILIQRDEKTAQPQLFFSKLPADVSKRRVLLVDPMLATGGSATEAIRVLREAGVPEQSIVLVSIVAAPAGIERVVGAHPQAQVVVGEVDRALNARAYIVPGCGDFGDRFYGTD